MQVIHLEEIKEREIVPGFKGRFIHSEKLTIAHWQIKGGSILPDHSHHHEQVINLIEGKFELTIDEKITTLDAGGVAVIPSHISHSGRALTDCYVIDIFYPVREDYKFGEK